MNEIFPPQQPAGSTGDPSTIFLLQKENAAFVTGRSRRPRLNTFNGCMQLFLLPFLVIGLFIIAWAVKETVDWNTLRTSGMSAVGEFTRIYVDSDSEGDTYFVEYQFLHQDRTYTGRQSVSREEYQRAELGGTVELLFAPHDPTLNNLASSNEAPVFPAIMAVFWNLITWPMAGFALISGRQAALLAREGRLVRGRMKSASTTTDSDNDLVLIVDFVFRTPDGDQVLNGQSKAVRNDMRKKALPPAGTPVAVLYRNPKHFELM